MAYIAAVLMSGAVTTKANARSVIKHDRVRTEAEGLNILQLPLLLDKKPESRPAQVYGQLRFEGQQYLTPIPETPSLTYSSFLSARLSMLKEWTVVDAAIDISGGTFFSRGQSHYVVHELYTGVKAQNLKAYMGRKKKDWSELDRRWQIGAWQPNFAIDALRPEEQGLTGFFVDYSKDNLEVLAFASPIFIPSMGPDIREEGGGLVSDSRWYREPSRDYDFNSRINTIEYDLDIPDTMKLASNGSLALMTRMGSKKRGPWVVASAGYMPVNELLLTRKNFKTIDQDRVDVVVTPLVTHHHIHSLDVGYAFSNFATSLSYLRDQPDSKTAEVDWAVQELEPIQAFSAAVDFKIERIWGRTLAIELGYLKVNGGRIVDLRDDGTPDSFTLFDKRLKFSNAASIRIEGQVATFYQRPFITRFKYLYDQDQRGSLVNTEFLYYPSQKWAVVAGADVLGVQDENKNTSDFLNQYRANDRIYGGMTYVF